MSDNVVFLEYGSFAVYWYGVFIAGAVFLAATVFAMLRQWQGKGFLSGLSVALISMPPALICARIFYCWFAKASFAGGIADCLDLSKGGYALYGALAGILAVLTVYSRVKKESFFQLLDAAAPALLSAIAMGRFASIVSGDDIGFELTSPAAGMPYVIWSETDQAWILWVGFFEGVFASAAFVLTWVISFLKYRLKRKGFTDGSCALLFMLVYGYSQTFLESMRNDSLFMVTLGFVRISQIISIVMAVSATVIISVILCRKAKPRAVHYVIWVLSAAALGAAVYCEFKMNALQMVQNYIVMGLSLGFMMGGSVFLYFCGVRRNAGCPVKQKSAVPLRPDLRSGSGNQPGKYAADFGGRFNDDLSDDFGDGFDDDLSDDFGDGFDDDLSDGFGDGFDDDLSDGFGDGFDDDLSDGFGDGFDDDFDEEFINYFGLRQPQDRPSNAGNQPQRMPQERQTNGGIPKYSGYLDPLPSARPLGTDARQRRNASGR